MERKDSASFGRFATKMQSIFQSSQSSKSAAHLRAVPIMMSAGVLLLITTGLLFLFPNLRARCLGTSVSPRDSSGADNQRHAVGSADGAAAVTENQLGGGDYVPRRGTEESLVCKNGSGKPKIWTAMRRLGVAGDEASMGNQNNIPPQATTNELQTPSHGVHRSHSLCSHDNRTEHPCTTGTAPASTSGRNGDPGAYDQRDE